MIPAALSGWGGLAQPDVPVGLVWELGPRRPLILALALALALARGYAQLLLLIPPGPSGSGEAGPVDTLLGLEPV